jgi:hypothetical protein
MGGIQMTSALVTRLIWWVLLEHPLCRPTHPGAPGGGCCCCCRVEGPDLNEFLLRLPLAWIRRYLALFVPRPSR